MDLDRVVKCVVWDLDNTLWPGIAAEGEPGDLPDPDPAMLAIMEELERRGILNSLASRNDPALLLDVMSRPDLASKFVSPQVSWEPKSQSLAHIASSMNVSLDALAIVDVGWLVAVARLVDRFGDYGIIGAGLVDRNPEGAKASWLVDLLMLSCRVEGRSIPAAMLRWLMGEASGAGMSGLRAVYKINDRN